MKSTPGWTAVIAMAAVLGVAGCSATHGADAGIPAPYVKVVMPDPRHNYLRIAVPVGADLAVEALVGSVVRPILPTSTNPNVLAPAHWDAPRSRWYPFQAREVGTSEIVQTYPCQAGGCAANSSVVVVTVQQ